MRYFRNLAEWATTLLFGQALEEPLEYVSQRVFPLPWSAVGCKAFDADGVFIFEIGPATGDQRVRDALCYSIVSSVNQTGWWDYTVFTL